MIQVTMKQVEELISMHPEVVFFGREENFVGEEWIEKAEQRLGLELPLSYKWFLRKYAGGEIGGEEIFSLYGLNFEDVIGGDIVYQHINGIKNNLTDAKKLVLSKTDFGEIFFFDYSNFKDSECPVNLRLPSGEFINYASNFYEFLYKRILANI